MKGKRGIQNKVFAVAEIFYATQARRGIFGVPTVSFKIMKRPREKRCFSSKASVNYNQLLSLACRL